MIDLPAFDALALSLHHSPGVHAILVGSGLSRAAGIPTGWEITLDLVRRLAALDGVTEQDDWAQWYRAKYGKGPSYSELLHALASTTSERRTILQSYIDPPEGEDIRKPTRAHHAIAQLAASNIVRVVITTNFDRLIENAMREAGVEPTIIASDDAVVGATPLVHAKCTVIKVHGDYLDARIKNTDAELEAYSPAMNGLLDQVFDNFGLLVVGWSGEWDTALRDAIQRAPSRRYPFYWAARGAIGWDAQDLIQQRGGRSFPIEDADSFFVKLHETLEALRQASRPHPLSVEMAIALAKRYCRDDKFAMEWAEFLHAEVEKIREYATGPNYPTTSPSNDTLNGIVDAFMARTEILRRGCLICGRWGTPEANRAVARAIQTSSFATAPGSGYTSCLELREFGASIGFYWNMAGLLERGDLEAVHALQILELPGVHGPNDAVMVLPFARYQGVDWRFLKDHERSYVPASVFLAKRFGAEAREIALGETRGAELFDQTELIIALEHAHQRGRSGGAIGLPVGKFIWKNGGRWLEEELKRIEGLSDDDPFFEAGLMGGGKAAAAHTIQGIRRWLEQRNLGA
jgi:SIR2-like domain